MLMPSSASLTSILALLLIAFAPGHAQAQADTTATTAVDRARASGQVASTPAGVADEYHRAIQSMAWAALTERLHPDALAYMRLSVRITLDVDTTGWALERLLGGVPDRAAYEALNDSEVFRRVMAGVQREVPGLLSSLVARRSEILGAVEEGPDTAHVVYRISTLAQGAEPEVLVLTVLRTAEGWKVRYAEEIAVLHTALRRIPIPGRYQR
jgi:hypothetical protein